MLGTTYRTLKCSMMIGTVELQSQSGVAPQFGLLYDIITYGSGEEPSILFIFIVMETLGYISTFGAYEVLPLSNYQCVYCSSLQCHQLLNAFHHGDQTTQFIKPKCDLSVFCKYM